MSTLNKIGVLLLSLFILGCSINSNSNTEQGNVKLNINRISPKLLNSLTGSKSESRAYRFMDRVKITTIQGEVENSKIYDLNEFYVIELFLDQGNYTLKAEVYNDIVDTENSVVTGQVDITVEPGRYIYPTITLFPTSPIPLTEKEEIEVSNFIHTEMSYIEYWDYSDPYIPVQKNELSIINHGSEHWYKFKPANPMVSFEVLTNSFTYTPATLALFDSEGKEINSSSNIINKFSAVLDTTKEYYISVVPFKVIYEDRELFEDTIKFKVESFADSDNNDTPGDATLITNLGEITATFDGKGDLADFYKMNVKNGDFLQYETSGNINIIVTDSLGQLLSNQFEMTQDDTILIEVSYPFDESGTFSITEVPFANDGNDSISDAVALSAYNDIQAEYSGRGDNSDFYKIDVKNGDIIDYFSVDSIELIFTGSFYDLGFNQLEATADGAIYVEAKFPYKQNGFFQIKVKDPTLTNAIIDPYAYQTAFSEGSILTTRVGDYSNELIVYCDMSTDPLDYPYANVSIHRATTDEFGNPTTKFDLTNLKSLVFNYESSHTIRVTLKDDFIEHTGFSYYLPATEYGATTVEIKLSDFKLDEWSKTPRELNLDNVMELVMGITEKVEGNFTIYELYAH